MTTAEFSAEGLKLNTCTVAISDGDKTGKYGDGIWSFGSNNYRILKLFIVKFKLKNNFPWVCMIMYAWKSI